MALLGSHSSNSYTPYISSITLFMTITGFGFHSCKVRGWYWVFTYLNHLIILISVRLIPAIAKHPCNNESCSTERWKRYSALTGIPSMTGPDVNLYSGNTSKTTQLNSSFMGAYVGIAWWASLSFLGGHIGSLKSSMLLKAEMQAVAGLVPVLHLSQKSLWWSWKVLLHSRACCHHRPYRILWKYKL